MNPQEKLEQLISMGTLQTRRYAHAVISYARLLKMYQYKSWFVPLHNSISLLLSRHAPFIVLQKEMEIKVTAKGKGI